MYQSPQKMLEMKFDPNVITHLGIQMYSTLPPVISELISNAYDADATEVKIYLNDKDQEKSIIIEDNGHGMSFDEINDKFLLIGRNRRKDDQSDKSKSGKRWVIGKKGIGKLAFFGIATQVEISTIQNYLKTTFLLNWDDIQSQRANTGIYHPKILESDISVKQKSGTTIKLTKIKRKTGFSAQDLALSLSKAFHVFDEEDFQVNIFHNQQTDPLLISNSLRYQDFDCFVKWEAPWVEINLTSEEKDKYEEYLKKITGCLIASKERTIPEKMRGIALFSRGKLVNEYAFYGLSATSFGYSYLTGWLNVDFIEDFSEDVISTNRRSLNWETDETKLLEELLQILIKKFYNFQKDAKENDKKQEIEEIVGINLDNWYETLPKHERKLAKKIMNQIIQAEGLEPEKTSNLIRYVQDSYQFTSFKELAADISENNFDHPEQILKLMSEWQLIEAREFYKLAEVRLETIKKFEEYIAQNAKEVPVLHNFLKQFPWLLDPRIMSFKDEVTFSSLLKEKYPDETLDINDRRIDFLCQRFADSFFIIELKRPKGTISHKEITQALDYVNFIAQRLGNEKGTKVCCYLIAERLVDTPSVTMTAEALQKGGSVYVKTYSELLANAKSYHNEFIEKYESMTRKA
ncbi:hypothetical protein HMPREF2907_01285 [Neisseria sp. HMSC055H02]|nr:hypothetical protein HMPREF2907_01285 [Neisseria sp. HMSC055H02]